jgi:thioesterase domain-containing protein
VAAPDRSGGTRLAAFVVPATGADTETLRDQVLAHARDRLPEAMVPRVVTVIAALPLNAHGKLDVRQLPEPSDAVAAKAERRPPRTLAEAQLTEIWEATLGVSPIGVDDDFFDLGGHSLLAVRMMARVRHRLGRSAPLTVLFRSPTIAALARALSEHPGAHDDAIVVALREEGDEPPLFCVHPVGGDVLCYVELARAMGAGRPVYGVRAQLSAAAPATIEAMAARYLKEIRRIAPSGPYLLAGWSMGGLIALEIARRLTAAGDDVGLLALLDTHPPALGEAPGLSDLDRAAQVAQARAALEREGLVAGGDPDDEITRRLGVFERNAVAAAGFTVPRLDVPIHLLAAAQDGAPETLAQEWADRTGAEVVLDVVPGDHYGLLTNENAHAIAAALDQQMTLDGPVAEVTR